MNIVSALFLAGSMAMVQSPKPTQILAEKLSEQVVAARLTRVGVVPMFLQREQGKETLDGSMGPQGAWLAEEISDGLAVHAAGRFRVVGQDRMAHAFRDSGITIKDLGDVDALRKVSEAVGGIDALVIGRVEDERETPQPGALIGRLKNVAVKCNLIDIRTGDGVGVAKEDVAATTALRDYRGEADPIDQDAFNTALSWGDPSKGRNVPNDPGPRPVVDPGANNDPIETTNVTVDAAQGLHMFEKPDFPMPVYVTVDGKRRDFIPVRNPQTGKRDLYVPIEPGESYIVRVENKLSIPVMCAIYIDGMNILGKSRDFENPKYWAFEPGKKGAYSGFYSKDGEGNFQVEDFIVAPADDSLAAGQNFRDQLGQITITWFLPEGLPPAPEEGDLQKPGEGSKAINQGQFATKLGEAKKITLELMKNMRRGKRFVSESIHYAPKSQIEQLPIISR